MVETKDFGIGASYVWDKGYFGASYTRFLSYYGVPNDPETDEPGVPPARVHINMRKDQYNVRSSVIDPMPWFSVANLKFVYTDYKHDELITTRSAQRLRQMVSIRASSCSINRLASLKVQSARRYFTNISPSWVGKLFCSPPIPWLSPALCSKK